MSEVVHIAASLRILCIHVFTLARLLHTDQLARVFHHELTATERPSCDHTATFTVEVCYLQPNYSTQDMYTTIYIMNIW